MVARKVKAQQQTPSVRPAPLKIVLPLPTSVNEAYIEIRWYDKKTKKMKKKRVMSPELRAYRQLATLKLNQQGVPYDTWKEVEAVGCTVRTYVPTRASDLDNRVKHWQDVVAARLGFNDNKVEEFHNVKRLDPDNPRVEVHLYPIRATKRGEL